MIRAFCPFDRLIADWLTNICSVSNSLLITDAVFFKQKMGNGGAEGLHEFVFDVSDPLPIWMVSCSTRIHELLITEGNQKCLKRQGEALEAT